MLEIPGPAESRCALLDARAIDAIPGQMRLLFANLIGNSLKFVRRDVAPVISVSSTVEHIEDDEEVRLIVVADNGIGFDEQYADTVFNMFERLVDRSEFVGAGTGLATCRRIVERHRGTIEAHGALGEGAQFEVRLPIRRREGIRVHDRRRPTGRDLSDG
jgi:light-regulated signal transduction histidine kinase (bacteriophytochrome)